MNDTLTLAIIGHLVGDYLLQNDYLALHKKQNALRCLAHCCIWTICVMGFSGWSNLPFTHGYLIGIALVFSHFIQDHTDIVRLWMDLIGQHKFRTGPCAPWSLICVDNIFHILTIYCVWRWVV